MDQLWILGIQILTRTYIYMTFLYYFICTLFMSYMKIAFSSTSSIVSIGSYRCYFELVFEHVNRFHSFFNRDKNNVQLNLIV